MPRLDQLLAEIEVRGYLVNSEQRVNGYFVSVFKRETLGYHIEHTTDILPNREDAAADGVIYLLEQEGKQDARD